MAEPEKYRLQPSEQARRAAGIERGRDAVFSSTVLEAASAGSERTIDEGTDEDGTMGSLTRTPPGEETLQ